MSQDYSYEDLTKLAAFASMNKEYDLADKVLKDTLTAHCQDDGKRYNDVYYSMSVNDINRRAPGKMHDAMSEIRIAAFSSMADGKVVQEKWITYITACVRCMIPKEVLKVPENVHKALHGNPDYHSSMATAYAMLGMHDFELAQSNLMAMCDPSRLWQASMVRMKFRDPEYGFDKFYRDYGTRKTPIHRSNVRLEVDEPELMKGKDLLVVHEQGIGDLIMCAGAMRYLSQEIGVRVTYYSTDEVLTSFADSCFPGVDNVIVDGRINSGEYQYICNLMDLLAFTGRSKNYLYGIMYTDTPKAGLVGLNFTGNPDFELEYCRGIYSNNAISQISEIAGNDSIRLDKGKPSGPLASYANKLASLKCVVTTDTMTAHMAGAVGTPCLVLLAMNADWRWSYVWYGPNFRLAQQTEIGKWDSVLPDVKGFIEEFA